MDTVSILFVLLICIMGAVIAYFADLLGRHIGKRRLKLTRWLRPKYTAAVLAAVAGFLIPLITVGIVYALSSDVRVWMTEGRRAIEQRDQAIRDRNDKTAEAEQKTIELAALTQQAGVARENLRMSNSIVAKLNSQTSKLKQQAAGLQTSVRKAQAQLTAVRSSFAALQQKFDKLQPEYRQAVQTRDQAIKQRNEAHRELDRVNNDLTKLEKDLKDRQQRLEKLTQDFEALQKLSDEKLAAQSKAILEGANQLGALQRDIESKKLELDAAQSQLTALTRQFQDLTEGFGSGRRNPLMFSMSDELARIVLESGAAEPKARTALTSLVRAARSAASARGAVDPQGGDATAGILDPNAQTEAIRSATEQSGSVVMIARALWNAFKGETVPLQIEVKPNPKVYDSGTIIAEMEIDGRSSEDAIIGHLNEFITTVLRPKALRDGMIPAIGQEQPLGEVKRDTVLALVRSIRDSNRRVRVVAVAGRETRAADQLQLDFRLR